MLATTMVNDLDSIDFLPGQAPHRFPRSLWRISLDGRARPKPRVLGEKRGGGVTAGSAKRWSGCQQARTNKFSAGKPRAHAQNLILCIANRFNGRHARCEEIFETFG